MIYFGIMSYSVVLGRKMQLMNRSRDKEGDRPLLLLLAQHRSVRICRRQFFCPEQSCQAREEIRTVNKYTTHLKCHHGVTEEDAADLFGHMVWKFLPSQIETVATTDEGEEVRGGKHVTDRMQNFFSKELIGA
jgi:hypothetical protein